MVGFDQAAGDRIHLTGSDTVAVASATQGQQGGADTLITLGDGSTILLVGVTDRRHRRLQPEPPRQPGSNKSAGH